MEDVFFDIYDPMPRQGPGDDRSTRKALSMCSELKTPPRILDVGCGTGLQSLELARSTKSIVIAVDNHRSFLEVLRKNAKAAGLDGQIEPRSGDMFDLGFDDEQFNLIWSEGAIYIMGFEKGIKEWKRFLEPGGYLVASHLTWLSEGAPKEAKEFWDQEYGEMTTIEENLSIIVKADYEVIGQFPIPEDDWFEYYGSLEKSALDKKRKYLDDPKALELFDQIQGEVEIYKKFHEFYGYVFYVMRKPL